MPVGGGGGEFGGHPEFVNATIWVGDAGLIGAAQTGRRNRRLKLCSWLTLHVEFRPVQAPAHPVKTEPLAATAVSFTTVPEANQLLHVGWQLIPAGLLVTVPPPVPASVTVS